MKMRSNVPATQVPLCDTHMPDAVAGFGIAANEKLERIVSCIVDAVRPERIFVTDRYFLEVPENPDFLIVLPDSSDLSFDECHHFIALQTAALAAFTYTLHLSYDIHRHTTEGHVFYSVVCTPAHLLYDAGKRTLPLSLTERLRSIRNKAHREFYSGFKRGVSFLESAWYAYDKGELPLAAFLLQQAAELPLRSILLALTGEDLHTHSVSKLCSCCRRCAPQLSALFEGVTGTRLLRLLDSAYIDARYREMEIRDKAEIMQLFDKIKALHSMAQVIFETKLAAL